MSTKSYKHSFTLVEALVLSCIFGIIVMMVFSTPRNNDNQNTHGYNVHHDGHLFISDYERRLIHHPDCPKCQKQ
jgi:hypothetical protein